MKLYNHIVMALAPVADAFSGTVGSDIVSMKNHGEIEFIITKGIGNTGTSTITVEASDDVSASNTTAVPFRYQAITSGDTPAAVVAATTAGFATTAGSNQMYRIFVDASELGDTGYEYVRLKAAEVVDGPVSAGILAILKAGRFDKEIPATALT